MLTGSWPGVCSQSYTFTSPFMSLLAIVLRSSSQLSAGLTSRLRDGFIYTSHYWFGVSWSNRGDLAPSIMQQASLGVFLKTALEGRP